MLKKPFVATLSCLLLLVLSLLLGCESKETVPLEKASLNKPSPPSHETTQTEENKPLFLNEPVERVVLTKTTGSYKYPVKSESSIAIIQKAFLSAERVEGVVDVADPDLFLEIEYKSKKTQSFSLWMHKENHSATIMNNKDTQTVYHVSKKQADPFMLLIEERL
ncbi:hypothetical protein [Priestia koreensis]|uniref:hypothetical protein n=1 Tax=Priestia koreensis TaxID=284581 RepID=UPI0030175C1D